MAIDTRSKRASVLGIVAVAALTLPLPDASVGQPDRQHVAFAYPGITANAEQVAELTNFFDVASVDRWVDVASVERWVAVEAVDRTVSV